MTTKNINGSNGHSNHQIPLEAYEREESMYLGPSLGVDEQEPRANRILTRQDYAENPNLLFSEWEDVDELWETRDQEEPEDFIWPGFLAGTVGILAAQSGAGKSFLGLQQAIAVAGGYPADTIQLFPDDWEHPPEEKRLVLHLSAEDLAETNRNRVRRIFRRVDPSARAALKRNFRLINVAGKGFDIADNLQRLALTAAAREARLIVIDTFAKSHTEDENDNSAMSALIQGLEDICRQTGASVLLVHHVSKARAGDVYDQSAARGASALVSSTRYSLSMAELDAKSAGKWQYCRDAHQDPSINKRSVIVEDTYRFVLVGVNKINHGEKQKGKWYRRGEGGVLIPCIIEPVDGEEGRAKSCKGSMSSL